MIETNLLHWAFDLGVTLGGPACFFILVERKKLSDIGEARSAFNREYEKERAADKEAEEAKFQAELKKKDDLLKSKVAELDRIKPLLKYLERAPQPGAIPPTSEKRGFGEDTL